MPGGSAPPVIHMKRHVTTGPYPNDRRAQQQQQQQQQQHEHPSNNDSNNNNNNTNTNTNTNNNNNNHSNINNGYNNRGWKRPCMFSCFYFNKYCILIL